MTNVKVCVGTACHLKGSYNILLCFQQLIEQYGLHDQIALEAAFCIGQCQSGVCVTVGDQVYSVMPDTARTFFIEVVMNGKPSAAE